MDQDRVIETVDYELKKYGAVLIEFKCGSEVVVYGTDYKVYGCKLLIYNKDKLTASIYPDDIRYIGTIGMMI